MEMPASASTVVGKRTLFTDEQNDYRERVYAGDPRPHRNTCTHILPGSRLPSVTRMSAAPVVHVGPSEGSVAR